MAVFTEVGFDEADALCERLGLGALTDLHGIQGGIENTNYFATTDARPMGADAVRAPGPRRSCPTTCG